MIRVLAFSWSQADWGLLQPIVSALAESSDELEVQVYPFTPEHEQHVSASAGAKVHVISPSFDQLLIGEPMSTMFGSVASVVDMEFRNFISADHILLLGDRIQELAVATVASCYHIPVHHLFSGDRSGSLDDRYRDAITMLSTCCYAFSKAAFIRTCGLAAISGNKFSHENVKMPEIEVSDEYVKQLAERGIKNFVLCRLHPETDTEEPVEDCIADVVRFSEKTGDYILWLPPNQEDGWQNILTRWQEVEEAHYAISSVPVLPRDQYLGLLKAANLIVGNSSSFVHDAPLVGKEDIVQLIGSRQRKRSPMDTTGTAVIEALKENMLCDS